ncbi:hypothetical protein, partial [Allosphingosinicella sp.]|uniref:hypothetical protein n=1 Tax=Allosphingosinicella sp. TaxID=2823234 RepID=UPI002EE7B907
GLGAVLYDGPNQWGMGEEGTAPGPARLWLGFDPGVDWSRSAYLPIPSRLRPSPLNLVFKDLSGGSLFPDPDRIVFRGIDFDPY